MSGLKAVKYAITARGKSVKVVLETGAPGLNFDCNLAAMRLAQTPFRAIALEVHSRKRCRQPPESEHWSALLAPEMCLSEPRASSVAPFVASVRYVRSQDFGNLVAVVQRPNL